MPAYIQEQTCRPTVWYLKFRMGRARSVAVALTLIW
jgi:hypothetical protein